MSKKAPKGKEKKSARTNVDRKALEIVHADAAGIDVGGSEHWVAVNPERDAEPVRRVGCFTADVREMRAPPVARTLVFASLPGRRIAPNRALLLTSGSGGSSYSST
jgi:hypothetical protein